MRDEAGSRFSVETGDGVSLNQFIAAAVAEKVSVLETAEDSCADAGNR